MTPCAIPSRRAGRTAARFLAVLVPVLFLAPAIATASARDPQATDFFEYDYNTYLDQGTNGYSGYAETMRSHSRYEVLLVDGDNVTVRATGSWTWSASDGSGQAGNLDVTFVFSRTTRRYVSGIDVDGTYTDPAVWFWIANPTTPGQAERVLDDVLTVTSIEETVWLGAVPRKAVHLEGAGSYLRSDVYGTFHVEYRDVYYYDGGTGFIVAEFYEEHDNPAPEAGSFDSFRWREEVFVTASSYTIPIDWLLLLAVYAGIPAVIVASIYLVRRHYRGPRTVLARTQAGVRPVTIRRVGRPAGVRGLKPGGSRHFAPFLPEFARRALATGDPVVVAAAGDRFAGLLTLDGESGVANLSADDEAVAKGLLKLLKVRDYFAEVPDGEGWKLPGTVLDTFDILEVGPPVPVPYDTAIVRPIGPADLPAVTSIAEAVYQGRASRWIATCVEQGDLGFVAVVGDRVIGFGFATVAGTAARLHTLTVLPQHRARGIGSEIMAARLDALAALGVERAVLEISRHNVASQRVARKAGFVPVGRVVYLSTDPRSAEPAFQRQY